MKQVATCPPRIPTKDSVCCAHFDRKKKSQHNTQVNEKRKENDKKPTGNKQTAKSLKQKPKKIFVFKKGAFVRILRVFDG